MLIVTGLRDETGMARGMEPCAGTGSSPKPSTYAWSWDPSTAAEDSLERAGRADRPVARFPQGWGHGGWPGLPALSSWGPRGGDPAWSASGLTGEERP